MKGILIGLLVSGGALMAQPTVTGALNSAGYMLPELPNGGLARGSFVAIFGTNIGPAIPATGIVSSGYPLQTTFSGVSARIGGRDLHIVYASPGQVGAIVPSDTPLGQQPLTLTFGGNTSAPFNVKVVARSFGLFTLNQRGTGAAVGLKFISAASQPPSTNFEAMNPGGTVTFFGTGLGASDNPDNIQAINLGITGLQDSDVEVWIGGKRAPIRYVGRSSCCASIDQIVTDIPADVPLGCSVPLVIRVAGVVANVSSLSIAPAGKTVCSDPGVTGFSEAELTAALAKGEIRAGTFMAMKMVSDAEGPLAWTGDMLMANFSRTRVTTTGGASAVMPPVGACWVVSSDDPGETSLPDVETVGLDAGPSLTVQNANGTKTIDGQQALKGSYFKTIMPAPASVPGVPLPTLPNMEFGTEYLTTGNHTLSAPGGADLGAFNVGVPAPPAFTWTNPAVAKTISRANPLTINWTGGEADDVVLITGSSGVAKGGQSFDVTYANFTCVEAAPKGTFSVPSYILGSLPPTGTMGTSFLGSFSVSAYRLRRITIPGLDWGYAATVASQSTDDVRFN